MSRALSVQYSGLRTFFDQGFLREQTQDAGGGDIGLPVSADACNARDHQEDHHAVIEKALPSYQGFDFGGHPGTFEQVQHGDGVGGTNQGAEQQGPEEGHVQAHQVKHGLGRKADQHWAEEDADHRVGQDAGALPE